MRSLSRQRSAMVIGLMVFAAVVAVDLGQVPPASAATLTINAVADSYVSGASTGSNFGTSPTLIANATGPVYTHLMFTVTGSGGATSATLQVYSTSSGTVKTHFEHAYEKLGVHDRASAVAFCLRRGLID